MSTASQPGGPLPPLQKIPRQIAAVADYAGFARERLDPAIWAWLDSGAGDGVSAAGNLEAFQRLRLTPRVLADVAGGNTRLQLLGTTLEHPIMVAPVGYQRLLHPEGELATALAASALRAAMVVSTQASVRLEQIAEVAQSPLWFQLYVQPDRGFTRDLVQRAQAAGCQALVVTVDAPIQGLRNAEQRTGFALPPGITAANLEGMAIPPPHQVRAGEGSLFDSPLLANAAGWQDIEQVCRDSTLPVLVKGILHPDDASQALACGAAGLIVSNHGGRVLDGAPAALDALPQIAARVGPQVPLLVDGGIRRGTDVLKALALGARAVLVGRGCMHGLATAGAIGVAHVLHLLRTELEAAMVLTGCRDLAAIDRSRLWPPD